MFEKLIIYSSFCVVLCFCNIQAYVDKTKSLKTALEDFTQEAYIHLLKEKRDQNFVFSPLSLHSALSLVFLGATEKSETYYELRTALGGLVSIEQIKERYKEYIKFLNAQESVSYGNHIWLKENYEIKDKYRKDIQKFLSSEISTINFEDLESNVVINNWIGNVTRGKITNLIDEFTPNTLIFLANAIFFKESWIFPFEDEIRGKKIIETFSTLDGPLKEVNMMQQASRTYKYQTFVSHDINFESIIIPYKNEKYQMKIIMPRDKPSDLQTLDFFTNLTHIKDLRTPDEFNLFRIVGTEVDSEEVNLTLPPFKIRSKIEGKGLFQDMNVKELFTDKAQLNKITDDKPVGVGNIIHEAVIDVTKNGTEGAAATGIEIVFFSAGQRKTKEVIVNKPFIFIIEDKEFQMPLLVGRVLDPLKH